MQTDEQAIGELVTTWLSATERGEREKVSRLMAEDVVFLVSGRPPLNKAEFTAGFAALESFNLQMTGEIQGVKVFGDWAYCWNKLSVSMEPKGGGTTVKRSGDVLSVLQKRAGAWVIVRDANLLSTSQ